MNPPLSLTRDKALQDPAVQLWTSSIKEVMVNTEKPTFHTVLQKNTFAIHISVTISQGAICQGKVLFIVFWKSAVGKITSRMEKKVVENKVCVCVWGRDTERDRKKETEQREGGRNVKHQQHSSASPCTACSTFPLSFLLFCTLSVQKTPIVPSESKKNYRVACINSNCKSYDYITFTSIGNRM